MNAERNRCKSTYLGVPIRPHVPLILSSLVLITGCGYIADPLPPSPQIPRAVTDLGAVERGETVFVEFTAPALTTDSVPLRRMDVDLRAGPDAPDWEARATRIETAPAQPGRVRVELSAREWANRDVLMRVRLASRTERFGEWSNAVRMKVVPPLETPQGVQSEAVPAGVRLSWKAPAGTAYRVYRRAAKQAEPVLMGTAEKPEFVDAATQYGTQYEYWVEAFTKGGDAEAMSERSAPAGITPEDHFAPAVPSGLTATAGTGAIQVAWSPNTEDDLRGYYVYRSATGGAFERIGDLLPTPYYADRAIQTGVTYRYSISAMDQKGNESARTEPAEATAP